jgi:hypothetical protein
MSACHWRTQCCKVTRLHVKEGESGVQLQDFNTLKNKVVCSFDCVSLKDTIVGIYKSSYHWRTQWCAVKVLGVTEGHGGVQYYVSVSLKDQSGVKLYVCVPLMDSVLCSYMSAGFWRTQWCEVIRLLVTEETSGVKLYICVSLKDQVVFAVYDYVKLKDTVLCRLWIRVTERNSWM